MMRVDGFDVSSWTAWSVLALLGSLLTAYVVCLITYRLTLHPLAKFPGPFLCRISSWQQCYYEAILNGKFLEKLPEYHRRYGKSNHDFGSPHENDPGGYLAKPLNPGPIVRISPNEVHLQDASLYHEIYKQGSAFTKDATSYALGVSEAMAFTAPVDKHRRKRKTLESNFSKQRIALMEDGMYDELELVFDRVKDCEKSGKEVPIMELYFCYTGDIISRYLFGESMGLVKSPDFIQRAEQMRSFTKGIWVAVHFQFIRNTILALPRRLMALLSDEWVKVLWFTERLAKNAIRQFDMQTALSKAPVEETIFDRLLIDHARRREKGESAGPPSFRQLADESTGILNAGTEPAASMLSFATYFWLKFPHVQARVLEELESVQLENGRMPLPRIEALPYFTGFVKESLRYMPLVPGRLPRVVPAGGLFVPSAQQTVPEGAVVGLSHLDIHFDPEIFERPLEFLPERWMGEKGKELNHWLLSFSKGRTDCIGKTLAYAEMHLILANLFRRFDVQPTPDIHRDMVWMDRVIVHSAKNLRIKVKSKETF